MKTIIKKWLARAVEIVTGRRCENCKYNRYHVQGDTCEHHYRAMARRCQRSIYPCGWEKKGE